MERERTCCFTGHRENKLPWRGNETDARCVQLKKEISRALERAFLSGMRHFICGMATGCDLYFAEAVLALREKLPGITLEAAIPWEGQAQGWSPAQQRRYDALRERCDYETVISESYTPDCLKRRNEYMVDSSALVIAVYSGAAGGTRNTMLYAMRKGVELYEIEI
ncbi:MAG: DUF1273 family protein [Oscillospiraceae bacterium]|nr:DUF1273 family protein [Oscillospiraceae bacterium]